MNLEFVTDLNRYRDETDPLWLSSRDRLTVLHEFGHALGLGHEHFHEQCQKDLKFDADPGYAGTLAQGADPAHAEVRPDASRRSPGLFRFMAGWPNGWNPEQTRLNYDWKAFSQKTHIELRKTLPKVGDPGFAQSATIDQASVMLYRLRPFLLKSGAQSKCLAKTSEGPVTLSAMDRQAFALLYKR
jgi:hypothetical protein